MQYEACKLNSQEVVEEDKRLKLPPNWEAKKARLEWELQVQEKKKVKLPGELGTVPAQSDTTEALCYNPILPFVQCLQTSRATSNRFINSFLGNYFID